MNRKALYTAILGTALVAAPFAFSQDAGGPGGGRQRGGGPGGGGDRAQRFDPEQMRQRMAERMREQLGVTNDEEWKALQPLIEKVQRLQMQSRAGGGFGGGRGPGGPGGFGGGGGGADQDNPVATASRELRNVLENQNANADQIKARLDALRDARAKAREELTKAQNELREVLTVRQEAVLVSMGTLE